MDGWTDTRGGNVLINGRAPPPLPRGRINIFGCSTTRGRRQCRDRERGRGGGGGWIHGWRRPKHVAARAASRAPQN